MLTALFDLDGTLLDTERIYQKYWKMAGDKLGFNLSAEDFLGFRSLGHSFAIRKMEELTGSEKAYDEIRNCRKELMDPIMKDLDIPLKPYVKEALTLLKDNGFRLGVATATRSFTTDDYLRRTGLSGFFDKVISARMVKEGKPAPDVYQFAASEMGVKPEEAFAVEDAPNGVLSAARAGCRVIMIPDLTEPDEELMKHIVLRADNLMEAAEFMLSFSLDK
jgi:DNA helicase-2/ATP-dependent DNA helicase PcrA